MIWLAFQEDYRDKISLVFNFKPLNKIVKVSLKLRGETDMCDTAMQNSHCFCCGKRTHAGNLVFISESYGLCIVLVVPVGHGKH